VILYSDVSEILTGVWGRLWKAQRDSNGNGRARAAVGVVPTPVTATGGHFGLLPGSGQYALAPKLLVQELKRRFVTQFANDVLVCEAAIEPLGVS
jgi:hypothetical protein